MRFKFCLICAGVTFLCVLIFMVFVWLFIYFVCLLLLNAVFFESGCCLFCKWMKWECEVLLLFLICDACSCKWVVRCSISVSSCKCCMFVFCVQTVAMRSAVFCTVQSFCMFILDAYVCPTWSMRGL